MKTSQEWAEDYLARPENTIVIEFIEEIQVETWNAALDELKENIEDIITIENIEKLRKK